MFEIIYDEPAAVYEKAYRIFFCNQYLVGVLVNIVLAEGACFLVVYSSTPILGYIILVFSVLYMISSYYFHYAGPLAAIRKRRSGRSRIVVNEDMVQVIGEEMEMRFKLTSLKKTYKYDKYVYLMFKNDVFVIIDLEQLNEKYKSWLFEKVVV